MADNGTQLPTGDVRNILRRGCKEAHSTVVFSLPDGGRYEARWYVRLKRTGTCDKVSRSLRRLAPHKETVPEKEIQDRITALTGLDYTQFTRTVMLAQNSFANFLKARREEKSALLEKLTGTEIYGRISVKVHELTAEARRNVEALENEMKGVLHDRLSPEELAETNEDRRLTTALLENGEERLAVVRKQLGWFDEYDGAVKRVQNCEERHTEAHKALVMMRADQLRLERYDDVLCMQPLYQEIMVRRADIEDVKQQETQVHRQVDELRHLTDSRNAALTAPANTRRKPRNSSPPAAPPSTEAVCFAAKSVRRKSSCGNRKNGSAKKEQRLKNAESVCTTDRRNWPPPSGKRNSAACTNRPSRSIN